MQTDLNIYKLENELILDFEPGLLDTVTARIESHLAADQVNSWTRRRTLVAEPTGAENHGRA